ncbi:hypothetical protein HDU97_006799 [Phlyctochytrium planicorne]|nr:hypothetical protein HDU97_006799 [Phlyctochytrium planicorne]
MGNVFTRIFSKITASKRECRILVLGLDNAGKTSILYRLKLHEAQETAPTVGFNVETIKFKNIVFQMWDCGGQDSIRPLWVDVFFNTPEIVAIPSGDPIHHHLTLFHLHSPKNSFRQQNKQRHYFKNSNGLVFVVDSTDKSRFSEAGAELRRILESPEMESVAVLVVANKQDLPEAMSVDDVSRGLGLYSIKSHHWNAVGASAVTGDGLAGGLQWLSNNMQLPEAPEQGTIRR